ncbi:MAG: ATP-binding protein [Turicibacter sp.]|nr:ATP-binding protein [Turicibacter sp.]
MQTNINITHIEVENFKNIRKGSMAFPNVEDPLAEKHKVLGLYGQNGSGKTAIVQAFKLLKCLITGKSMLQGTESLIFHDERAAMLKLSFSIVVDGLLVCTGFYQIVVEKEDTYLMKEIISYKLAKKYQRANVMRYEFDAGNAFLEDLGFSHSQGMPEEDRIELLVQRKRAKKEKNSFLFSPEFAEVLRRQNRRSELEILTLLKNKFHANVVIISSEEIGYIYSNLMLPVSVHLANKSKTSGVIGHFGIDISKRDAQDLDAPLQITQEEFHLTSKLFEQLNLILPALVPGLTMMLQDSGSQTLQDGSSGVRAEFLAKRGRKVMPLFYESDGVKKIISILSVLVALFNNKNMFVVIDELDAGIYEFLLGELIDVLNRYGKGQFLFTSHNLRLLEVLNRENLMFTTTNENNRFITFKGVKQSNNIRDLYLRAIQVGGQSEEVYAETDLFKIRRAFERAGRVELNHE